MNNLKTNIKVIITLLAPLMLLSACTKRLPVTVSTIADVKSIPNGFSTDSSFCILPAQKNNQLLSKEMSYKIMRKLEQLNYKFTNAEDADYYIKFDYSINQTTKTITVAKYIPAETTITKGKVNKNGKSTTNYQEETIKPGTTIFVPELCTFYNKEINIIVFDAPKYRHNNTEENLWEGSAASSEENNDPRENIDYLITSALNRFGKDTRKNVEDVHKIKDKRTFWEQILS